ncbi:peroxisomal membrane protein 4 [Lampetra fluviatilis]
MEVPAAARQLLLLLNRLLAQRRLQPALAALKGLRNGAVYGAKIRAPHALVMTFLFRTGSLEEKVRAILRATYQHSRNLACFVLLYKGAMALLRMATGGQRKSVHAFLAASLGGWLVFGENNQVNSQINMYLLSRVLFAAARVGSEKGWIPTPARDPFPLFAALVWGSVLWLFEHQRHTLQPSLQSSMTYLYRDSEHWTDLTDFLIYNKRP